MADHVSNDNVKRGSILMMLACPIFAATILIQGSGASANDSIIRFGKGGIEFVKSEDVRMVEEVLEISIEKIRVKYRFLNESDKDIHATVAFPAASQEAILLKDRFVLRGGGPSLAGFKAQADGRSVSTKVTRKAAIEGSDITTVLRKLGLSDEQIFNGSKLTENQTAALEKLEGGTRKLVKYEVMETATWEQAFPAGKEVVVEHEYSPSAGGRYSVPYAEGGGTTSERIPDADAACIDEITRRGIEKRIQAQVVKGATQVFVTSRDVEYILATGRNWKGAIGEFKLRIEKETPDQIVSICFPGKPRKVSPTVLEFVQKDFVPPDKLVVLFYMVGPEVYLPYPDTGEESEG